MENKKAINTCRIVAFMGILIGLLTFVFGILVCSDSDYYGVNRIYNDSYVYGADYYTDSYHAMAINANNTYATVQLMSSTVYGIGLVMLFGGLALMLGFIIKFANSFSVITKKKVVKYVQCEEVENKNNDDTKILIEYLRKSMEKETINKEE